MAMCALNEVKGMKLKMNENSDRKAMAIVALVLGILSIVLILIPILNILLAIAGIILGALSLKSSKHGLALGGLICGIVGLVIGGIFTICTCAFTSCLFPSIKDELVRTQCENSGATYNSRTKCCIYSDGTKDCLED